MTVSSMNKKNRKIIIKLGPPVPKIPKILPKQIKRLYPPKQNWQHSTKQQQQLYKQQHCSNNTVIGAGGGGGGRKRI